MMTVGKAASSVNELNLVSHVTLSKTTLRMQQRIVARGVVCFRQHSGMHDRNSSTKATLCRTGSERFLQKVPFRGQKMYQFGSGSTKIWFSFGFQFSTRSFRHSAADAADCERSDHSYVNKLCIITA